MSMPLNIGADIAKGCQIRSRCSATTRTSSILRPQRYSIGARQGGPRNWQASTSASTTDQETGMGNHTLFQDVQSTALKKGGAKTSRLRQFCKKDNFAEPDRQERTFICSSARLASFPPQEWSEEFAEAVKKASGKDSEYQGAWKELEAVLGNVALND